jgi:hypothetical protein
MLLFFYHPPTFGIKHRGDGKTRIQLLKELDYVGLVLFIASNVLFLLGLRPCQVDQDVANSCIKESTGVAGHTLGLPLLSSPRSLLG